MAKRTDALDRFWRKVERTDSCWVWIGAVSGQGYGSFWFEGASRPAHRWIYGQIKDDLVEGSHIDHLCRNTRCVRPDHLEQVTERENILRGTAPSAQNSQKTVCIRGHALTGENLRITADGRRNCATCFRVSVAKYEVKRKERRRSA